MSNNSAICYFVCAIVGLAVTSSSSAQVIYQNNFDQHTKSRRYKVSDLNAEWNNPPWDTGVAEGRAKIETGYQAYGNSGSCLAIKTPKGKYGPSNSGAQWKLYFDASYEEVYATYNVKFKRHFDFVKGGKLPGLCGGTAPTGTTAATGFNGWTGRLMWRTFHTGNPGQPKQKTSNAISYAKYFGSGYDGDGKDEDKTFFTNGNGSLTSLSSNRWYQITQRVKMNDPWVDNGVFQIWLDGQLVVDKQDVRFRNTSSFGIDQFYFSNFFGGGSDWKTSKYETVYFDNFIITAVN